MNIEVRKLEAPKWPDVEVKMTLTGSEAFALYCLALTDIEVSKAVKQARADKQGWSDVNVVLLQQILKELRIGLNGAGYRP